MPGRYDFVLDFTPEVARVSNETPLSAPFLPEALKKQLGLKLVPKKLQLETVVVDRIDKIPTAN